MENDFQVGVKYAEYQQGQGRDFSTGHVGVENQSAALPRVVLQDEFKRLEAKVEGAYEHAEFYAKQHAARAVSILIKDLNRAKQLARQRAAKVTLFLVGAAAVAHELARFFVFLAK